MFVARDSTQNRCKPGKTAQARSSFLLLYVLTNTIRPGLTRLITLFFDGRRAPSPLGSRMIVSALGASHHDGCEKQESSEEDETAQTVQGIPLSKQMDAIPFLEAAP